MRGGKVWHAPWTSAQMLCLAMPENHRWCWMCFFNRVRDFSLWSSEFDTVGCITGQCMLWITPSRGGCKCRGWIRVLLRINGYSLFNAHMNCIFIRIERNTGDSQSHTKISSSQGFLWAQWQEPESWSIFGGMSHSPQLPVKCSQQSALHHPPCMVQVCHGWFLKWKGKLRFGIYPFCFWHLNWLSITTYSGLHSACPPSGTELRPLFLRG